MPEGPELFLASIFINAVSKNRLYGGPVIKSEVSTKNPDVNWNFEAYRISAVARGKELKITLEEGEEDTKDGKRRDILFRFGMSGSFKFTSTSDLPKHAHLRFFTAREKQPMVLSFVDYRRFGRWEVDVDWSRDRGPDPMWEYQSFRENVLANLKKAAFNKPICEAMLNQKFFNGIGNYLRAEILYRCKAPPFDEAREVLSDLKPFSLWYNVNKQVEDIKIKTENGVLQEKPLEDIKVKIENGELQEKQQNVQVEPDLLDLCHIVPKEVINLEGGAKGYNVDPDADEEEYAAFKKWLQCYYQDGMHNMVDSNRRTIWFSGAPGKLVPKDPSSRSRVERKRKGESKQKTKSSESKKKKSINPTNQEVSKYFKQKENKVKNKKATQKTRNIEAKSKGKKSKASARTTDTSETSKIRKLVVKTETVEECVVPRRRSSRRSSSQST